MTRGRPAVHLGLGEAVLRRVGGLLYVSDRDNGDARLRVMQRLGIPR